MKILMMNKLKCDGLLSKLKKLLLLCGLTLKYNLPKVMYADRCILQTLKALPTWENFRSTQCVHINTEGNLLYMLKHNILSTTNARNGIK